jgi:hypothetical protein
MEPDETGPPGRHGKRLVQGKDQIEKPRDRNPAELMHAKEFIMEIKSITGSRERKERRFVWNKFGKRKIWEGG